MALLYKCCELATEENGNLWVDLTPSIVALAAVIFSIYQLFINYRQNRKEKRRNEIYKKLNEFYGPYRHLREKSFLLYQKFQKEFREQDSDFRTLKYLLDGYEFPEGKKAILRQIIDIGERSEKLIYDKAGLIDDDNIEHLSDKAKTFKELLSLVSTHYLILRLVFEKSLTDDSKNYGDMVFPREIDAILKNKETRLKEELNKLNKSWF